MGRHPSRQSAESHLDARPSSPFPSRRICTSTCAPTRRKPARRPLKQGDAAAALAGAAKKVQASYEFPFQSHATMGPGCAVADVHPDGVTTVWSGGQKPHALQKGFAELLHVPLDKVRVIWVEDAGSYGRPGFEDAAADAVLLSQAVGKPVRVQWMRADMTPGAPKARRWSAILSAGLDARRRSQRRASSLRARFRAAKFISAPTPPGIFSARSSRGIPNTTGVDEFAQWGSNAPPYSFPNLHAVAHVVPAFLRRGVAAAHHASARSRRPGHIVRRRILHGRNRRGGRSRPDRIPHEVSR